MRGTLERFAVGCVLLGALSSPAVADDQAGPVDLDAPAADAPPADPSVTRDHSAQLANTAMAHYNADRWAEARAKFVEAYEAYPHTQYLFYIGDTYRREGAHRTALMYFNRYLESAPPDDMLRRDAQEYTVHLHRALGSRAMGGDVPVPYVTAPPVAEPSPAPMTPGGAPPDPRDNDRLAFVVSSVLTVGAAAFWGYSATRVLHYEDEKEQALVDAAQNGVTFDAVDACDDADGRAGAEAARVDDACDNGQRWAIVTNASLVTALIGVGITSYIGYRAFIADPDSGERAVVEVAPAVGPTNVGVTGTLRF